jgi:hypothetical protein
MDHTTCAQDEFYQYAYFKVYNKVQSQQNIYNIT